MTEVVFKGNISLNFIHKSPTSHIQVTCKSKTRLVQLYNQKNSTAMYHPVHFQLPMILHVLSSHTWHVDNSSQQISHTSLAWCFVNNRAVARRIMTAIPNLLTVGSHVEVVTSQGLLKAAITKCCKGENGLDVVVQFKGSKKPFRRWFHGESIHKIYSASAPAAKQVPHIQERAIETWHRTLVDKWK